MRRTSNFPLAYFISFRPYGTWLHGDPRGSVDRHRNVPGTSRIPPSRAWQRANARALKFPPVYLDARRRSVVEKAIRENCRLRGWRLLALAVRTTHVHTVLQANADPSDVLLACKANATRLMREHACWHDERSPWSRGGSKRYLWGPMAVELAIRYVLDEQGGPLPEF